MTGGLNRLQLLSKEALSIITIDTVKRTKHYCYYRHYQKSKIYPLQFAITVAVNRSKGKPFIVYLLLFIVIHLSESYEKKHCLALQ